MILRHWAERKGLRVYVYQAESVDMGSYRTARTHCVHLFTFRNERKAKLCEYRLNDYPRKREVRKLRWQWYFKNHVNVPAKELFRLEWSIRLVKLRHWITSLWNKSSSPSLG